MSARKQRKPAVRKQRAPAPRTVARVLVTAFDAFGGSALNASQEALAHLPTRIAGTPIVRGVLPTVFKQVLARLAAMIGRERPTHVLCVGEAAGRGEISVERVAVNIDDASLPDNTGAQPIDTPIVARGPAAYFATLPVKAMVTAIHAAGLPAVISHSAGTFVCNHAFYGLMHLAATRFRGLRAGFIHVPRLTSMSAHDAARGLTAAIAAALAHERGSAKTGGRAA